MKERRYYPRIITEWPFFIDNDENQNRVGDVYNVSLSGIGFSFLNDVPAVFYEDYVDDLYVLRLRNKSLISNELLISGEKKWLKTEEGKLISGFTIGRLDYETKRALVRFLSRNGHNNVSVILSTK